MPAMPSPDTLEAFIARVVSGAHAEAIEEFYTPDSTMQENQAAPRVGREANAANERRVLSKVRSVHTTCVRPVFVNGDHVVIRWIFRFDRLDGTVMQMEELAWQRWEGERIAEETFFYDPAQLVPKAPSA
jgi:ketosteroid isomerase-like protein